MTIRVQLTHARDALAALAAAVTTAKGGHPLTPVTVMVPTNATGVMARRALGRAGGVAAIGMVTPYRLAELLAGPGLHDAGRRPVSTPALDLAIKRVLTDDPGAFGDVAQHASTVAALRDLHRELRRAGPAALQQLAGASRRGREAARVSAGVTARLAGTWYDEGDLLRGAIDRLVAAPVAGLEQVVVFLPHATAGLELELLRAIGAAGDTTVVLAHTGVAELDLEMLEFAHRLGAAVTGPADSPPRPHRPETYSVTDADDEVRHAVRLAVQHARAGVAFARMAILWPSDRPYARLVEHHLDAAGLPWNGRPGTLATERVVPRFLLDLLDVDRRGLRRSDLFDLLADVPTRGEQGQVVRLATWERIAREAGVNRPGQWAGRLARFAAAERARAERSDDGAASRRWAAAADAADELAAFVAALERDLGDAAAVRTWREWADWSTRQIEWRLGNRLLGRLDEAERLAHEHTTRVLDRLRHLDTVGRPVRRSEFREVFAAEFDVAPGRLGRIGDGITVGSLTGAIGLDSDLVIVLGGVDGLLPPAPDADPLVGDLDRQAAQLPTSRARARRAHRNFLAVLDTATSVVVGVPRGDLRSATERPPSRWLAAHLPDAVEHQINSHHAGLLATEFPAADHEHRLRDRLAAAHRGAGLLSDRCAGDPVAVRALAMRAARRRSILTEFDGDLSSRSIEHFTGPVSPSRLEAWAKCPHGYFMRYLLGVQPIDDRDDELALSPLERGNVVHVTLDRFHREVIVGHLPQPGPGGWGPVHEQHLLAIFDEVADDFERTGRTGRAAHWQLDRRSVRADLVEWFRRDGDTVAARGAEVVSSELRFGRDGSVTLPLPDGRRLAVHGSIDRIDRQADGALVVMDHKSGADSAFGKISAADPTEGATKFQLPTYAAAALAHFGGSDGPLAVHAEYDFFARGGYHRHGYTFDDAVWAQVSADLGHLVAGIEAGLFPATPDAPGWHAYVGCHYCEPDGLGTAERFAEWQLKQADPRLAQQFAGHDAS